MRASCGFYNGSRYLLWAGCRLLREAWERQNKRLATLCCCSRYVFHFDSSEFGGNNLSICLVIQKWTTFRGGERKKQWKTSRGLGAKSDILGAVFLDQGWKCNLASSRLSVSWGLRRGYLVLLRFYAHSLSRCASTRTNWDTFRILRQKWPRLAEECSVNFEKLPSWIKFWLKSCMAEPPYWKLCLRETEFDSFFRRYGWFVVISNAVHTCFNLALPEHNDIK